MKSLFAVAVLVGLAVAQLPASLPNCGKVCINNMLAAAPALGCPPKNGQPDAVCLCSNVDFSNGIRDCVTQSCPAGTNTTSIIAYGIAYCDAALASASAAGIASTILTTITSDGKTITTAIATTTILAGAGAGAGGHSGETAITTKPIISTESDGSKTTIGSTTIYSSITAAAGSAASSGASEASSKSASASSVASSAEASASSVASSAASAASSVAASASSAGSAGASSASAGASSASAGASSASSSAGAMPMVTVAAQAFVGMAGLAAAFAL